MSLPPPNEKLSSMKIPAPLIYTVADVLDNYYHTRLTIFSSPLYIYPPKSMRL
jgi:hypothetical protein